MQTVASFLVLLLLAVFLLLVLALVMPLRILLTFNSSAKRKLLLRVQPFGRFGPRILVADKHRKTPKPKKRKKNWTLPKGKVPWDSVKRLIIGLFGAVHFEEARLEVEFGLNDPADTGQAFGLLTPLLYGSGGMPHVFVRLRPVFDRACLSGVGHLHLKITPAVILWPLVRFGWTVFGPER